MLAAYRQGGEGLRPRPATRDHDGHGAAEIGAVDPGAQRLQRRQGVGVGVPVLVVGADADQGHLGAHRRQERGLGRAGTVVGHGQHLGRQPLGPIGQQVGLRLASDVAREQHPGAAVEHPQHQRGLVALAAGEPVGPAGRGMQHLDGQVTEVDPRALDRGPHGHPASRRCCSQLAAGGRLGGQRPHPQRPHTHPPQHLGDPADVVEIRVGDHHQIEVAAAMPTQPPRGGPVGAGIDQDPGPW